MPRLHPLVNPLLGLAAAFLLGACGGQKTPTPQANVPPTAQPEVIAFATPAPPTATPVKPTATPLPTPKPKATATLTATTSLTLTGGIVRAENENPLTGLVVPPEVFTRRPLHVRIGNDPGARPQINVNLADVVYEEIVEWWITRLTAVYYTNAPEIVAPIRSARLINTQLTGQYDAALVNSGGSDPVRWQLSQLPIINLDEYFHPDCYFYREGEGWQKRLAVNITVTHQYMVENKMQKAVNLRGFTFQPTPPAGAPAQTIYVDYPSKDSKVLWEYVPARQRCERQTAGEPMMDGATNEVMFSHNVIIYFAEHYKTDIVEDSTGATSVGINLNGEGEAWIFRDGALIKGRWRTDGTQTPEFIDAAGKPIPLHPGKTWIQVVPADYEILVDELP